MNHSNLKNKAFLPILIGILSSITGCAGSPAATRNMNAEEVADTINIYETTRLCEVYAEIASGECQRTREAWTPGYCDKTKRAIEISLERRGTPDACKELLLRNLGANDNNHPHETPNAEMSHNSLDSKDSPKKESTNNAPLEKPTRQSIGSTTTIIAQDTSNPPIKTQTRNKPVLLTKAPPKDSISLGSIFLGMTQSEYLSTIGISPINCNTYRDKNGRAHRYELKDLSEETKTLCLDFSFRETGSTETINIGNISYDVVEANYESSPVINNYGNSSKAIFFENKLIYLEIYSPKVDLETLTSKYGNPKLIDDTTTEVCTNKIGGKFNNEVGNAYALWKKNNAERILRVKKHSPHKTCTDGFSMMYYILQYPNQLQIITNAIIKYKRKLQQQEINKSPF